MKIILQCECCGNNATLLAKDGKSFIVRDNLERDDFYCTENEIKDGKTKEILLKCNKCKNWIVLDMS